jgi:ketosteroid isomerase-like protein
MPETSPETTPVATPREVFETFVTLLAAGKGVEAAELYAEDAVVELPFALPAPERMVGRAVLRERFGAMAAAGLEMHVENIRVHETADPEVIVAEFDFRGLAGSTGRSFHVTNIQVLRIRDGLIRSTRDYHDHAALGVATGQLAALGEALGGLALDRVRAA